MKVVTTAQMKELDARTISEHGIPGEVLMERAGRGVARCVRALARRAGIAAPRVRLIAGKGNNGGDAFVAARYLARDGVRVDVWLAAASTDVNGDALTHLRSLSAAGVAVTQMPSEADWDSAPADDDAPDLLVDGLLGTGAKGAPHGVVANAIRLINRLGDRSLVVAIDVPSGLDADSGEAPGEAVQADVTVTMGYPKRGFLAPVAADRVGVVEVVDLGIPAALAPDGTADVELITEADVRALFCRRARQSHKGVYGHVLVMSGSAGYAGAAAMAARAALRSGAGLVSAVVPHSIAAIVAAMAPEVMVHGVQETEIGSLSMQIWNDFQRPDTAYDAIVAGPGMSRHNDTRRLLDRLLRYSRCPLVLDADALNAFESHVEDLGRGTCPVVVTPHPGEMARLLDWTTEAVQADRLKAVLAAASATRGTVVLKGGGTLVAEANDLVRMNLTGNPGMATGGTGDVLAGMIGGLIAQGLKPCAAACAAVYVHGRAGDTVAYRTSQAGLIAGDIIEELPAAFREVTSR